MHLCLVSTFALVDSINQCVPVTVYNMAATMGLAVGDSIAIPEPFYQETDFVENDKVMKLPSISVRSTPRYISFETTSGGNI